MTHIIPFLCTTLGGFLLGMYFRKRVCLRNEFFCDLTKYISALKLNVTGKQWELQKFNAEFLQGASTVFADCLTFQKFPQLNTHQKKRVQNFFACLDCASGGELLQNLEFFEKQFDADLSETAEEVRKCNVYVKICLLLGAMVGILFL